MIDIKIKIGPHINVVSLLAGPFDDDRYDYNIEIHPEVDPL